MRTSCPWHRRCCWPFSSHLAVANAGTHPAANPRARLAPTDRAARGRGSARLLQFLADAVYVKGEASSRMHAARCLAVAFALTLLTPPAARPWCVGGAPPARDEDDDGLNDIQ